MYGFKTKSNSNYTVDPVNKTISGGALGKEECKYTEISMFIGLPAKVRLADGRVLTTSIIEHYLH